MTPITLNGEVREVPEGMTVSGLLAHLGLETDRVAVELNEGIVKKSNWEAAKIQAGDRIEVVTFVGGGLPRPEDALR